MQKSIIAQTFIINADSPIIDKVNLAVKQWTDASKTVDPKDRMGRIGMPCHHAFNELVAVLAEAATTENQKNAFKEFQAKAHQSINLDKEIFPTTYFYLEECVRLCRVSKCYDKSKRRLEVAIAPGSDAVAMWRHALQVMSNMPGVSRRPGQGPPTALENAVQAMVDRATEA
eukprot:TRINITY_DN26158_c0_g1_i1.p3 TRINITY_DN26158_c0_g1~~TRINITY_DN26158_c0_g1_i1.p3  ORF type:complete len:172 (-),score=38.63 TRINITY_DN26158_c0_g1_i1:711-1226(-)